MRQHDLSSRVFVDTAEIDRVDLCRELEQTHANTPENHRQDLMAHARELSGMPFKGTLAAAATE